ncbi:MULTISPECIES: MarR family transcriptional regulator [unclassified Clostridium]|uniref:MarR family winged helix-turn-helix transcriptional regulator n=1 Tax=unclassified Clostridium TaxID=2614128 RepID=UPI0032164B6D
MDEKNLTKLSEDFFLLMMLLHKKIIKLEDFMKNTVVPPSHVKVVFYLAQNGPSSVSSIARDLCISKPNMTPIIDKLLECGYVNRYEDPKDRRVIRIEITEKANEVFKIKKDLMKSFLKEKLSVLPDEDLISLNGAISEFKRVMSKIN